jgi:hypothetical protein
VYVEIDAHLIRVQRRRSFGDFLETTTDKRNGMSLIQRLEPEMLSAYSEGSSVETRVLSGKNDPDVCVMAVLNQVLNMYNICRPNV